MVATRSSSSKLKTTLISGFLGSGKTTLLHHILKNKQSLKCAVIVNDMAELNIDASLVKKDSLIQTEERLVELQNGCICCTLREDLLQEVTKLAKARKFDYLVIESTGISEPQQVAETFELPPAAGAAPLKELATLDCCVTVLDAATLLANAVSIETVAEREGKDDLPNGERNISDLLLDQVEFADVILLNKTDLVKPAESKRLAALLQRLNPTAKVIPTLQSKVDLKEVLNTGLFDFAKAEQAPGWLQSLRDGHTPETEEYGIASFVYRARRPFHPGRLWALLSDNWVVQQVETPEEEEEEEEEEEGHSHEDNGLTIHAEQLSAEEAEARHSKLTAQFGQVLRSKGYIWLAGRDDMSGEWSQAGSILRIGCAGPWFAAMPEDVWPDVDADKVKADFDPVTGDRRQEIVFIGIKVKKTRLTEALDACLCSVEEEKQGLELLSASPFIQWPQMELVEVTDSEEEAEKEEELNNQQDDSPKKKARSV